MPRSGSAARDSACRRWRASVSQIARIVYDAQSIDRPLLLRLALIGIPIVVVCRLMLAVARIEIGFPPGTNPLLKVALIGVFLHAPALMLNLDSPLVLFLFGYLEIVVLSIVVVVLYRVLKGLQKSE